MKTLTITISIPDGVEVHVATPTHAAAPVPSSGAAATPATHTDTGTPFCAVHGIEKRKDSKYGGYYCSGQDPNGPKGYCSWQYKP